MSAGGGRDEGGNSHRRPWEQGEDSRQQKPTINETHLNRKLPSPAPMPNSPYAVQPVALPPAPVTSTRLEPPSSLVNLVANPLPPIIRTPSSTASEYTSREDQSKRRRVESREESAGISRSPSPHRQWPPGASTLRSGHGSLRGGGTRENSPVNPDSMGRVSSPNRAFALNPNPAVRTIPPPPAPHMHRPYQAPFHHGPPPPDPPSNLSRSSIPGNVRGVQLHVPQPDEFLIQTQLHHSKTEIMRLLHRIQDDAEELGNRIPGGNIVPAPPKVADPFDLNALSACLKYIHMSVGNAKQHLVSPSASASPGVISRQTSTAPSEQTITPTPAPAPAPTSGLSNREQRRLANLTETKARLESELEELQQQHEELIEAKSNVEDRLAHYVSELERLTAERNRDTEQYKLILENAALIEDLSQKEKMKNADPGSEREEVLRLRKRVRELEDKQEKMDGAFKEIFGKFYGGNPLAPAGSPPPASS